MTRRFVLRSRLEDSITCGARNIFVPFVSSCEPLFFSAFPRLV